MDLCSRGPPGWNWPLQDLSAMRYCFVGPNKRSPSLARSFVFFSLLAPRVPDRHSRVSHDGLRLRLRPRVSSYKKVFGRAAEKQLCFRGAGGGGMREHRGTNRGKEGSKWKGAWHARHSQPASRNSIPFWCCRSAFIPLDLRPQ